MGGKNSTPFINEEINPIPLVTCCDSFETTRSTPSVTSDCSDSSLAVTSSYCKNPSSLYFLSTLSHIYQRGTIGTGGLGETCIVHVDGIENPCVFKKLIKRGSSKVIDLSKVSFFLMVELYSNPSCLHRIPRPLFFFNNCSEQVDGVLGYITEFCEGGNIQDFVKYWCIENVVFLKPLMEEDEEEDSDILDSSDDEDSLDSLSLNPLKVCSLCVGMIECLDDILIAKPQFIHRNIKPENFLVRIDHESRACDIVLDGIGLDSLQEAVALSPESESYFPFTESDNPLDRLSLYTTQSWYYYAPEAFDGVFSQSSDAYSLGMAMLSIFLQKVPYCGHPILMRSSRPSDFKYVIEHGMGPKIDHFPIFKSLETMEDGKYLSVYQCFKGIFREFLNVKPSARLSIRDARERVQSIKDLLPVLGEGWKFFRPSELK
ncbi:hypothetical protein ADUPG1_006456 [Aduncisulcus paluster]|uniref:Protein kinase domain-containing protein n=1 Tax=Aduncisulcus paluster TaxID=2918883 RepID=A0ABQ5KIC6_9EUKA|nr:hypothetical protein ADUPG1_006456 [Aduncisulcus paluster]